jgi:F0F1-type ATP synthase epsilon subunit
LGNTDARWQNGVAEVDGNEVVVMVESCESAANVDVARAELAHSRAEAGLSTLGEDAKAKRIEEFEDALARARNRLVVAQRNQR